MSEMNKTNDQRWENHSDFLADFAGNIAYLMVTFESGNSAEKIESVEHLVKTLSFSAFKHAEGHCLEDFENGVFESSKVADEPLVGNSIVEVFGKVTQKADVSENQMSGEISVSGDRVKRVESSFDTGRKGWDVAKRGPHVYENTESVGNEDIDDDSVIKTQEECAKRFAEGEAVRRNYAGIND